ncbi:MAG: hypothetical protein ACYSWU_21995, partial [Planctomycetota bacterium]
MSSRAILSLARCRFAPVLLSVLAVAFASPAGAEIKLSESSLQFVPADAAFYVSFMRNRQQYETVVNSRAFGTLMEMPFVKSMQESFVEEFEDLPPQIVMVKESFDLPENKPLKETLIEMVSDEVFIYGGKGYCDLYRMYWEFYRSMMVGMRRDMERIGELQLDEDQDALPAGDREMQRAMLE